MRELEAAGARAERAITAVCRSHGLSHAALNALATIEGNVAPIAPGELAERMLVTSGSMTSLIDNLEKRGLVTRRPDTADRRRMLIDITAPAQELLDIVLPAIQQLATSVFASMPERQLRSLLSTLDDVQHAFDDLPDDLPPATRTRPPRLDRPG